MKCPHCLQGFYGNWVDQSLPEDKDSRWLLRWTTCPSCEKLVVVLLEYSLPSPSGHAFQKSFRFVRPKGISRSPLPPEVPDQFAADYKEACLVLPDSEKASAALSRRCLQNLLLKEAGVKKADLNSEIQQVIDSQQLPSHLANAIDAVRVTGNFAAHPIESIHTGEIVDVQPGEAEWQLDTLEGLFDFYFVLPAKQQQKRDALDKKLKEAGKPPLKQQKP